MCDSQFETQWIMGTVQTCDARLTQRLSKARNTKNTQNHRITKNKLRIPQLGPHTKISATVKIKLKP